MDDVLDEAVRIIRDVVYCTVTTVDPQGRPRSRVMHPIFERADSGIRGWALTDRSPVKTRHLAQNPHVSCFYWSPAQETVSVECRAAWVGDDDERELVWRVFRDTAAPLGWGELTAYEPERIHHPLFQPLRLTPWRVGVVTRNHFEAGDLRPRTWRAR